MEIDEARLRSGLRQLLPPLPDDGALERVIRKGRAGRRRRNMETAAGLVFVVAAVVLMVVGVLHAVGNLPPVPPVVTTVPAPPPVPDAGSWQRLPVSVSVDGGGLGHTPVVSLVMDPSDPSILYAATALGLFKSNDSAQTWSQLPTIEGEVFLVGVDPASPSTVYAVQPPLVDAPPYLNRLRRSDDGGVSWTDLSDADGPRFISAMITMMWFDTTFSPSAICTRSTDDWNVVLRSTDRGETWTKLSTDQGNQPDTHSPNLPAAVQAQYDLEARLSGGTLIDADTGAVVGRSLVSTMSGYVRSVVVDPDNLSSTSYVRTEMGVYKSIDGGGTWRKASPGVPSDQGVITLVIDPSTPSTLYATLASGIVKSTDGGANWSVILNGTSCFLLAPSNPSRFYAWTYEGLFRSDNGGDSWTRLVHVGLPTFVPVLVVADQPDTACSRSRSRTPVESSSTPMDITSTGPPTPGTAGRRRSRG